MKFLIVLSIALVFLTACIADEMCGSGCRYNSCGRSCKGRICTDVCMPQCECQDGRVFPGGAQ